MHLFPIRFAKATLLALMWDCTSCGLSLSSNSGIPCGVCQVAALEMRIEISELVATDLKPTGEIIWRSCGTLHPEMEVSCGTRCQVAKYKCINCQVLAFVTLGTYCREHSTPPICYEDENERKSKRKQQLALQKPGEKRKRGG
ncbi:hypothetical protein PGT21_004427 [Puccinia graminis f. sp. tritici]|uniref:Uncharacterized protein n=1 Tax=Puccinia graminis f. sp. tritici TaxID=56615 RepID=A0A5B0RZI8_PUCGR|nr:hypothetical protein PGT21_004427 [Puccinia graminis f. sp. tritici]KAA1130425.1 hypothetical protein PGTUg99_017080 [Puccinia graminis f. sp. tritici]KAA1137241.1 hypothetical protein PGTUg99_010402 [Puccinia graminis f. sp. tritici]